MMIRTVSDFRRAMRNGPYAWPGGYPLYFVMADGEALSYSAAKEHRRDIVAAIARHDTGWCAVAFEPNYEDAALFCCHSGDRIESAYCED